MLNALAATTAEQLKRVNPADTQLLINMHHSCRFARRAMTAGIDASKAITKPWMDMLHTPLMRLHPAAIATKTAMAAGEIFERSMIRVYDERPFNIKQTTVDGTAYQVKERVLKSWPFGDLVHFQKCDQNGTLVETGQPNMLVVPPMSGHFSTLVRGTIDKHLSEHETYTIRWRDASMVRADHKFDKSDYRRMIMDMMDIFGGDVHVLPVCQPGVPVVEALALMEMDSSPNVPHSFMPCGSPFDTRINPTLVNKIATEKGSAWFEQNVIGRVPPGYPGAGRKIYPGFLQLTGFMSMNMDRHINAHQTLFRNLISGDGDSADKHKEFYDEYLAVMDLTAEFYLETVRTGFVEHHLPRGLMEHEGRRIDLKAMRRTALFAVEGEKDDITGIGQCAAILAMCPNVPEHKKDSYVQPGVGHYGLFEGGKFRDYIAPRQAAFVKAHQKGAPIAPTVIYDRATKHVARMAPTALPREPDYRGNRLQLARSL